MASRSREEQREYMRAYRANRKSDPVQREATVTHLPTPGRGVLNAVEDELKSLPLAERRPADAAMARAMARILDDPKSIPQQAQAAARLMDILKGLRGEVDGGKSKLATLRSLRAEG